MSKEIFKEGIKLLKTLKSTKMPLKEMSIYLETVDGEIVDVDLESDDYGELRRTFSAFDNEEDYEEHLNSEDEPVEEVPLLN